MTKSWASKYRSLIDCEICQVQLQSVSYLLIFNSFCTFFVKCHWVFKSFSYKQFTKARVYCFFGTALFVKRILFLVGILLSSSPLNWSSSIFFYLQIFFQLDHLVGLYSPFWPTNGRTFAIFNTLKNTKITIFK